MKTLLFLTNLNNDAPEEDIYLSNILRKHFHIIVAHPVDGVQIAENVDGIIVRNIWPTHEYKKEWKEIIERLRTLNIPIYNPLSGKGDIHGKDYLISLTKNSYPVIPSVDSLSRINELPHTSNYWIKPKEGCDGFNAKKINKSELEQEQLNDYIIQPYIIFEYELRFFFVDNQFSHVIRQKHRLNDRVAKLYKPSKKELSFAQQFVDWNKLPYGIQCIDAIKTREGLLLTEVEDISPYLYIQEVPSEIQQRFTQKIVESVRKVMD